MKFKIKGYDHQAVMKNCSYDPKKELFTADIRCNCGVTSVKEFTLDYLQEAHDLPHIEFMLKYCGHKCVIWNATVQHLLLTADRCSDAIKTISIK